MSDLIVELLARRPPADTANPQRLRTLLELLDRPDHAVPSVWVGGGHGKSSVSAMMSALFAALDISAGTTTSPHLQDLRERMRSAGAVIPADTLREQLDYLDPFLHEVDSRFAAPLGFEDVVFVLAAVWFADVPVDVAIHEGHAPDHARSDLTVALDTDGAVVHSDGTSHTAGDAFGVADREVAVGGQRLSLRGVTGTVPDIYLPLHGRHQADNAAVALAAVEGFLGLSAPLDVELVRQAFARVRLPGRLEVVRRTDGASIVLDGARDEVGAHALAAALRDEFAVRHRIGVLGLVAQHPERLLRALAPVLDHAVITPAPTPDAVRPADVTAAARRLGVRVETADTVEQALDLASGVATTEDAVVVTGSLQTAGGARRALGLEPADTLLAPP
ncbi:folylpolyglutamate synthase/dihydrofolate synthase family protein [soil metagenome]